MTESCLQTNFTLVEKYTNLARILQNLDKNTNLARFCQKIHFLQEPDKKNNSCKNIARFLQEIHRTKISMKNSKLHTGRGHFEFE